MLSEHDVVRVDVVPDEIAYEIGVRVLQLRADLRRAIDAMPERHAPGVTASDVAAAQRRAKKAAEALMDFVLDGQHLVPGEQQRDE